MCVYLILDSSISDSVFCNLYDNHDGLLQLRRLSEVGGVANSVDRPFRQWSTVLAAQ